MRKLPDSIAKDAAKKASESKTLQEAGNAFYDMAKGANNALKELGTLVTVVGGAIVSTATFVSSEIDKAANRAFEAERVNNETREVDLRQREQDLKEKQFDLEAQSKTNPSSKTPAECMPVEGGSKSTSPPVEAEPVVPAVTSLGSSGMSPIVTSPSSSWLDTWHRGIFARSAKKDVSSVCSSENDVASPRSSGSSENTTSSPRSATSTEDSVSSPYVAPPSPGTPSTGPGACSLCREHFDILSALSNFFKALLFFLF